MHKIRWQLVITFLLLHFAVLLVGNGAGLLINAERVRNDTEALIHEQRIIALELAKKTDLPAEEIVGTLASAGFEMYIVPIPESLTPQQLGQLMEGGVVYEGGVGRLKMYFMLREEVVLCEFQIIQSQVFIATVRTFLSNLLVSLLILGAITLVSKRMVRPIVELTQATREVAAATSMCAWKPSPPGLACSPNPMS